MTHLQNVVHPLTPLQFGHFPHVLYRAELHALHLFRVKFFCGFYASFQHQAPNCLVIVTLIFALSLRHFVV